MSQVIEAPVEVRLPEQDDDVDRDTPWIVIVWNDPINLMSYVTFVLRKLFGYSSGEKEKAEFDVARLHAHGLWATLRQDR